MGQCERYQLYVYPPTVQVESHIYSVSRQMVRNTNNDRTVLFIHSFIHSIQIQIQIQTKEQEIRTQYSFWASARTIRAPRQPVRVGEGKVRKYNTIVPGTFASTNSIYTDPRRVVCFVLRSLIHISKNPTPSPSSPSSSSNQIHRTLSPGPN